VLAKESTPWVALGVALLSGGVLGVLGSWAGLFYQTSRQRQARRADRQETRLLALQDLLGEVEEAVRRAMAARVSLSEKFEQYAADPSDHHEWEAYVRTSHPDMEVLRSLTYRLRLLAAGVEHEPLRIVVSHISRFAWLAPLSYSVREAEDTRAVLIDVQNKAVDLLGEQLRSLP
jgi:uncharacterized membrane protein YhiD involved in acid resistance